LPDKNKKTVTVTAREATGRAGFPNRVPPGGAAARRRGKFFRRNFSLIKVLAVLLLFSGCDLYGKVGGDDTNIQGALPDLLRGEWAYIPPGSDILSEAYRISGDTVSYGYGGGSSPTDYTGTVRFVSNYSSDSGLIIIEYSSPPSYALYNGLSFFAIYYRNLRSDMVQLANAIDLGDYSSPDTATLEEAVAKFTRMTMGNYVDWGVVQPQRRVR
jgi:hypothetical protein